MNHGHEPQRHPQTQAGADPGPCVLVIFGASGDLTKRKLAPALFDQHQCHQLPDGFAILGISRSPMSDDQFREHLREFAQKFAQHFDEDSWRTFAQCIHYHAADATVLQDYEPLSGQIASVAQKHGCGQNVLFYLSVSPELYEPIINNIGEAGLVTEGKRWCSINTHELPWQRIIVEKPFGTDLESAQSLNRALGKVFEEESIYRIDHYLGKELIQNILVLRFANTIFEPIWNRRYIDHIQITAVESVDIGSRAGYYDSSGAVRDMIQSHLLQVLALATMEPPNRYDAKSIRREKIKLTESIRIAAPAEARQRCAMGQYGSGQNIAAYSTLKDVGPASTTETFAAVQFEIDNWRWSGVPFYLRTGKALARKLTEVVVMFRHPPLNLFAHLGRDEHGIALPDRPPNRLIINIQPDDGISLRFEGKVPAQSRLESVSLDFDYIKHFGGEPIEAYGPLILDAMRGDQTLFKHKDEVEGAWEAVTPYLDPELREGIRGNYAPGSWGPACADKLLADTGRKWHNPMGSERR